MKKPRASAVAPVSAALAGDLPTASAAGETTAPVEGEPSASAEGETTAPVEGEPAASAEGEATAPVEGEPAASAEGEATAPVEDEATDDDLGGFEMGGQIILVRSASNGTRRRAGHAFGPVPVRLAVDDLSEDQLAAILAAPQLITQMDD